MFAISCITLIVPFVQQAEREAREAPVSSTTDWTPCRSYGLCGVYSLFAVSSALGHESELESWIRPEFFSESWGSTSEDLVRAANDNHLEARLAAALTPADIQRLGVPALLHVQPRGDIDMFLHWVAYLGQTSDGQFSILDPVSGPEFIDFPELSARFDGNAVLVGNSDTDWSAALWSMRSGWVTRALFFGFSFMCAIILANWLSRRFGGWASLIVIVAAAPAATLFHCSRDGGLLRDQVSLAGGLAAHSTLVFEEASLDSVKNLASGTNPGILVDARVREDFAAGAIPGAVNMPLQVSLKEERELVQRLEHASEVVVYCQSAGCRWSDYVARRLAACGIRRIRIYREGYAGWARDSGIGK